MNNKIYTSTINSKYVKRELNKIGKDLITKLEYDKIIKIGQKCKNVTYMVINKDNIVEYEDNNLENLAYKYGLEWLIKNEFVEK